MKKLKLSDLKSIAILQTAFLGDVALTLPLVDVIKRINSDLKISFITTIQAAPIVNCSANVDEVIIYDKRKVHKGINGIRYVASELKSRNIECIISPHRSFRSTLISYFSCAKIRVGFSQNAMSFLYNYRAKYLFAEHEIRRNLELLKFFSDFGEQHLYVSGKSSEDSSLGYKRLRDGNTLNFANQDDTNSRFLQNDINLSQIISRNYFGRLNLRFTDEDEIYLQKLLIENNITRKNGIILIAPGSVWATKRWLAEYYTKLAELLNNSKLKCIIIGSAEDSEICDEVAKKSGSVTFAGKLSIPQTLLLMKRAKLTITNDSAPTHFAGLVNCPAMTIFGPTSSQFGFAPWSSLSKVIEDGELNCKPCAIHGNRKCPIGTHECMVSIKPEAVYLEVVRLLNLNQL